MNTKKITVTKASGKKELFSEKKIRRSIRRAKIPVQLEDQVVDYINNLLYDGISTSDIFKHILEFIENSETPFHRGRYSLKQAIMQLGPSGYPFEKFIASILSHHGYLTQTNIIMQGRCVEHEIDVIAEKNRKRHMLECKFHNQPGARSDIKVALYTQARFEDLKIGSNEKQLEDGFHDIWLVTNTKATTEAIKYAECVNMQIIGWSHPRVGNLQELIESEDLQPITSLSSLSDEHKKRLLDNGLVLCKDILKDKNNILKSIGIRKDQIEIIKSEIKAICNIDNTG